MKTKNEILEQLYLSASDLKILIPKLGLQQCRDYIDEARLEMQKKGYLVPKSKPRLALTKIVKKKLGI